MGKKVFRDFRFKMCLKWFWIDFEKKNFFSIFFWEFSIFFAIFWPKINFLAILEYFKAKIKNTFLWTYPPFYYVHFKLSARSPGLKMQMPCSKNKRLNSNFFNFWHPSLEIMGWPKIFKSSLRHTPDLPWQPPFGIRSICLTVCEEIAL